MLTLPLFRRITVAAEKSTLLQLRHTLHATARKQGHTFGQA